MPLSIMFHFLTAALLRNDKATFYTDTMASPHMRGRQSIVPYVDVHSESVLCSNRLQLFTIAVVPTSLVGEAGTAASFI